MSKLDVLLSGLNIRIEHKYDYMAQFCEDYVAQFEFPDIVASADDDAILKEKELVPKASIKDCESLCIYRAIAEQLPLFERFVFHGAAIEYDENAYLFTAPSGTGKTTHINLWRKHLGNKVSIINGDKPIIKVDDVSTVYGTPWAGKEGYQHNACAPIKAICILRQSKTNKITKLEKASAVNHLMRQVYLPQDKISLSKTLVLLGKLIETTPVYILECDISQEAFETSFNTLTPN